MYYFHGRSDVYAVKWQNGKGYSPAIRNKWEYYHLRNNPEKQAQIVEYLPYTEQMVEEQILGRK